MSGIEITGNQGLLFEVRDQREPGWFYIDNEIVDKYGVRLGAYGIATYAVLSRRCNPATQLVTNLSQRDIATIIGASQDRVRKSLIDLAEFKLIHVEVPARPSPGIISTITLLKVKTTERVAFSSSRELNAWRSRNKEVKTKTINKTHPNPPLQGGNFRPLTSRETKNLNERITELMRNHLTDFGQQKYDTSGKPVRVMEFGEALELAAGQLLYDREAAWAVAAAAGFGDARKHRATEESERANGAPAA